MNYERNSYDSDDNYSNIIDDLKEKIGIDFSIEELSIKTRRKLKKYEKEEEDRRDLAQLIGDEKRETWGYLKIVASIIITGLFFLFLSFTVLDYIKVLPIILLIVFSVLIIVALAFFVYGKYRISDFEEEMKDKKRKIRKMEEKLTIDIEKDVESVFNQKVSPSIRHISVDLNQLLSQIRREGLVIPYKCPNCGGTLKITGKKNVQTCRYCDSDLDMGTLSDFIRSLL
jgi:hypothetical protein